MNEQQNDQQLTTSIESILKSPEAPITDINFLLNSILIPWMQQWKRSDYFYALPSNNTLVQTLVKKFNLPAIDQFPEFAFRDPESGEIEDQETKNFWNIVGHWIPTDQQDRLKDLEKVGGLLGVQDTVWPVDDIVQFLRWKLASDPRIVNAHRTLSVFIAPYPFAHDGLIRAPLRVIKPSFKPQDLPDTFFESAKREFTKKTKERVFESTYILPLEYNIAKIEL